MSAMVNGFQHGGVGTWLLRLTRPPVAAAGAAGLQPEPGLWWPGLGVRQPWPRWQSGPRGHWPVMYWTCSGIELPWSLLLGEEKYIAATKGGRPFVDMLFIGHLAIIHVPEHLSM